MLVFSGDYSYALFATCSSRMQELNQIIVLFVRLCKGSMTKTCFGDESNLCIEPVFAACELLHKRSLAQWFDFQLRLTFFSTCPSVLQIHPQKVYVPSRRSWDPRSSVPILPSTAHLEGHLRECGKCPRTSPTSNA